MSAAADDTYCRSALSKPDVVQVIQVGPLALPASLLLTIAAIAVGWFAGRRLGQSHGLDVEPLLWRMLLAGLVVARLAFVWEWRGPYFAHPLSIIDVRDGGWNAEAGFAAAILYGLYRARLQAALRRPVLAALLASGLVFGLGTFALSTSLRQAAPLPALTLPSLEGDRVAVPGFAGKPTVINLWASWCGPCQREMPLLHRAQSIGPEVNYVFVNEGETIETVARYLQQHQLPLRNVLLDARLQLGSAFGQRALPTTLFFDAQGRLAGTRIGELSEATLAQRLAEITPARPARTDSR